MYYVRWLATYISSYVLVCKHELKQCFCTDNNAAIQTSCVISPTNLTTLTINDGLEELVEFNCQCMDENGMISGTRWFLPNETLFPAEGS